MRFTSKENLYQFIEILRGVGYTDAPSKIKTKQWIDKLPLYISRYVANFEMDSKGLYIELSRYGENTIYKLRIGERHEQTSDGISK